ncbi:antibiotic biosynthesis monooxygenase family protein [Thetidibacter halocola]|uniref:Antibiotic biosynthesis monooxygenase n=1 Tax=Thetidibacter halocola TaxID=2827239 RepID=A0A8J7WF32_9RHOB|nr:antibiotic biosynthesis monooxygenase [Thetidibacter halocola]MBS0126440.1 antibiotic biosynthesis monooxygenase [Thetidibacter halocola]
MIAIIFEVIPKEGHVPEYLDIAAEMRPLAEGMEGFIKVERFQSLTNPEKLLSISFFEDEEAVMRWRRLAAHRRAQSRGRKDIFADYRLKVCHVLRDYGMTDRTEAPEDSVACHG